MTRRDDGPIGLLICLLLVATSTTEAFTFTTLSSCQQQQQRYQTTTLFMATEEEERAAAMTAYFAKAHEEKLNAMKQIEQAKQAEIDALRAELDELKARGTSTAATTTVSPAAAGMEQLASLSKEQLIEKLVASQTYLAKYVVDAQEQKTRAVQMAKDALNKQWMEKQPGAAPPAVAAAPAKQAAAAAAAAPAAPAPAEPVSSSNAPMVEKRTLGGNVVLEDKEGKDVPLMSLADPPLPSFAARVVRLQEADKAGKQSRWADTELKNLSLSSSTVVAEAEAAVAQAEAAMAAADVPPEVQAADHGLRADGGVGGLTLAERVRMGAGAAGGEEKEGLPHFLYQQRSDQVAKAGAAGKSRWSTVEIERTVQAIKNGAKAAVGKVG